MSVWIFDTECYRNYFLACFLNADTGAVVMYEKFNDVETITGPLAFPTGGTVVGFNSYRYDLPVCAVALRGAQNSVLKGVSDSIILGNRMPWDIERDYGVSLPDGDHIDLIEVAPGKASLKIYGGRMGSNKLQDLPISSDALIEAHQIDLMRRYCLNDCRVTLDLYRKLQPQLDLRRKLGEEYDLDLRSKSDAQIAEAVIKSEFKKRTGTDLVKPQFGDFVGKPMRYTPPPFIQFHNDQLKVLLDEIVAAEFIVEPSGKLIMPSCLNREIEIAGKKYRLGVGGLHSVDSSGQFVADDEHLLEDVDVASYYPSIILNAEFYPKHIGPVFLEIYRHLVEQRLEAKHSGDKVSADSLKITINGLFGKLGSKWSYVYSPDLLFHVTVTGQLALLMLIEHLGERAISANTDGLTLYYPNMEVERLHVATIINWWQRTTNLVLETTPYRRLNRRDISNYIAITEAGKVKAKGMFADEGMMKNPVNRVCIKAVTEYLRKGAPVEHTVWACNDVRDFLTVRTVNGGAVKDGEILGKSVRWYYSKYSFTPILYRSNGNTVPRSEGAVPLMDIDETIPDDLDRSWYIREAEDILDSIGA